MTTSLWTILAFCQSSLVMSFLLFAMSDGNPSLQGTEWCAAAVLVTTGIVYGWHRLRVQSGIYDLVLDEHARGVILPIGFGRKRPLRLNFDAVNSVSVEMIVTRKKRSRWVVMVSVQDGVARKEKLISWSAKEKADAFAVWLRERLHLTETAPQPAV